MTFIPSDVVGEEMLHISLAGNVLKAIGGTPKLYERSLIPAFPVKMPARYPPLTLHLREMTRDNLQTFLDVRDRSLLKHSHTDFRADRATWRASTPSENRGVCHTRRVLQSRSKG